MYAIYGNIYHQYTPNVSIYSSTMDLMGYIGRWHFPVHTTTPKVDEKMKMLREQMEYDKRLVTAAGTRLGSQKLTMDFNVIQKRQADRYLVLLSYRLKTTNNNNIKMVSFMWIHVI